MGAGLAHYRTTFFFMLALALFLALLVYGILSGDPGFIRLEGGTL
jgi:hypothetical protein